MPRCYLLTLCSGSAVDQQSNNVTLFNLVEQINVPPGAPPPPGGAVPLEIHAYFQLLPTEVGTPFDVRYVMESMTGLETFSDILQYRSTTPRYRTRTVGLPMPPVTGEYQLRVDCRSAGADGWRRESPAWPLSVVELSPRPAVTH
jgi:hypothetical protein